MEFDQKLHQETNHLAETSTNRMRIRKKNDITKYINALSKKTQEQILQEENVISEPSKQEVQIISFQNY